MNEEPQRHDGVSRLVRRILFVQFADPAAYPPLEHSSALLAERGWDVVFLGVEGFSNQTLSLPSHPRIRVKKLRFLRGGWKQKLQYVIFGFWTLYWACVWRPNWIYASDPTSAPVLWLVRQLTRVRVIYHEHDAPNIVATASTWFMSRIFSYRNKLARQIDLCVLPERSRLVDFLSVTHRIGPSVCVWNCPRLSEVRNRAVGPKRELMIHFHGSINRSRVPLQLIVAAARFNGAVRVQIAGYEVLGSSGYVKELTDLAAENGAVDLINFLGTIPLRAELLKAVARADIGLSLMPMKSDDSNLRHMVGASNKAFDCMACGLPLLVSDLPEWLSTFVEPGFAHACDPEDADSIENALRWYLEHPKERVEMGRKCMDKIRLAWNYETMFSPVLKRLESA
jgi:glycosyltransferase involved in cell wall biosynthesis